MCILCKQIHWSIILVFGIIMISSIVLAILASISIMLLLALVLVLILLWLVVLKSGII